MAEGRERGGEVRIDIQFIFIMHTYMERYKDYFSHLKTNSSGGYKAPHKAILLLTVTELVRDGQICSPIIGLNNYLNDRFNQNWRKYIQIQTAFIGNIMMPFTHIRSEKFVVSSTYESFEIDKELFDLMKDSETSTTLISVLISSYLAPFANEHKVNFNELNPYRDMTLRPYQIEGKEKIYKMWTQMRSIMFQMPTGTGKTKLFVSIARDLFDWGAKKKIAVKILFLAHRIELIDQISDNLGTKYNLAHALIVSQNREQKNFSLQVGSVQTLIRRLDRWEDKNFDIIIIDEAHHVKAESYKKILRAFPRAKVLGVTATPYRMSHESFHPEFDDLITSKPVAEFIKEKWLCDYEYYSIRPESKIQMDINSISRFALDGDYLDEAAADIMDKDEIRAGIVSTYEHYAKGKKGIVYTITKAHNIHVCNQFIEKGYKAVAIDDSTPKETRKKYVDDFRRGKIEIICNVNIFSEGFDCPDMEFIQLTRPTKSLSMFLQQVGRGLRPAEGKEKLIILDNVGLYNRFGFPSARRQWRRHFEGKDFVYTDFSGSRILDGREVRFIEEYVEGDGEVEMLHSTAKEIVEKDAQLHNENEISSNSYEPEFRYYLSKHERSDEDIRKIIKGIKNDVDVIIRGKYNSKHISILYMDNIEALELYYEDFRITPVMIELNMAKKNILTDTLGLYIDYLKWRKCDEEATHSVEFGNYSPVEDTSTQRSIAEVENEINIFKKWNRDVPGELLSEYHRLCSKT